MGGGGGPPRRGAPRRLLAVLAVLAAAAAEARGTAGSQAPGAAAMGTGTPPSPSGTAFEETRLHVFTLDYPHVQIPFEITLWILLASLAKIGERGPRGLPCPGSPGPPRVPGEGSEAPGGGRGAGLPGSAMPLLSVMPRDGLVRRVWGGKVQVSSGYLQPAKARAGRIGKPRVQPGTAGCSLMALRPSERCFLPLKITPAIMTVS